MNRSVELFDALYGAQTKGPKNTDKRVTDKKAKKADKRAKNQSYILIVFSMKNRFFNVIKRNWNLIFLKRLAYLLYGSTHTTNMPTSSKKSSSSSVLLH